MISGCFPLDPFYKGRPEAEVIQGLRSQLVRWRDS
jgi:hypothetical protein